MSSPVFRFAELQNRNVGLLLVYCPQGFSAEPLKQLGLVPLEGFGGWLLIPVSLSLFLYSSLTCATAVGLGADRRWEKQINRCRFP